MREALEEEQKKSTGEGEQMDCVGKRQKKKHNDPEDRDTSDDGTGPKDVRLRSVICGPAKPAGQGQPPPSVTAATGPEHTRTHAAVLMC